MYFGGYVEIDQRERSRAVDAACLGEIRGVNNGFSGH